MPNRPTSSANHQTKARKHDTPVAPAIPRVARPKAAPGPDAVRGVAGPGPSGCRLDQDQIDKIGIFRERGVTYPEIARRLRCSERSARRYGKGVTPRLRLPHDDDQSGHDPRAIRDSLLDEFMALLYANEELRSVTVVWHRVGEPMSECFDATYGGPPSILFLSEAERLLSDRLAKTGPRALQLLTRTQQSKHRFIREVVGSLFSDYIGWHRFAFNCSSGYNETGEDWRPPSERSGKPPEFGHVDLFDLAK